MSHTPPWADRYGGTAVASRWPDTTLEGLDMRLAGAADVPETEQLSRLFVSAANRSTAYSLEFRSLTSVAGVTSGAIVVLLGVSP
jgi:hypothetical protein